MQILLKTLTLTWKLSEKDTAVLNICSKNLAEQYRDNTRKKYYNFRLHNATLETIKTVLSFHKFLKDSAEVLALLLCNLVYLSVKQSLFPDQCTIGNLKSRFNV